jgi:hypothetical protein
MRETRKPNGPAAAALLAAGAGVFATGLLTTLAEVSSGLRGALTWWSPAGPLTGKTGVGVIVWLVAWIVLHAVHKNRDMEIDGALRWAWILIALGFLGTFPPFFEAFAP